MEIKDDLRKRKWPVNNIFGKTEVTSDFATYLGAEGTVYIMGAVVDSKGNYIILYVEQYKDNKAVNEMEFKKIGSKIHLVKISADGKKEEGRILYEGDKYIEVPMSIEIDKDDNVYITGMAINLSLEFDIEEIIELIKTILIAIINEEFDMENIPFDFIKGFLLKFDSKNMTRDQKPIYSNYFGGKGITFPFALVDDKKGHIWITGMTSAKDFPIKTTGAPVYQKENRGALDVFICKLNNKTADIEYSTYVGGKINDIAQSIYVDDNGNVYVTGIADRVEKEEELKLVGAFNVTPTAFQNKFGGGLSDAFVIKLKNDGEVVYCSYLGNKDNDIGTSITADISGNAYITGSTGRDFTIKGNPFQKELGLKNEGIFIAKVNSDGTMLTDSTYIGGNYTDSSKVIKFVENEVYLYGTTASKDFPMCPQTYQPVYFGDSDVFFSKLSSDLGTLKISSYLGGTKREVATTMIILNDGSFLLLGDTLSVDFPITEGVVHKKFANIKGEGFIFRNSPKSFDVEVNIPDINLKKALYEILKKKETDKITEYNLMLLPRYIDLSNKGIENIDGIQYAKYMLGIDLRDNLIENIDKISELKYLNYLDLRCNEIRDVSPLSDLIYLSYLYISNNKIDDISYLENLNMMTEIKAENNKIENIDAIGKMKRIRTLNLDNNSIGDFSVLKKCGFLSKISALSQKIFKDISKNTDKDVVLKLDFLKKINSDLPIITDISNDGKLDYKKRTITWTGITADTKVYFKFEGSEEDSINEYMNGEVEVKVKNNAFGNQPINGFSTYLGFESAGNLASIVRDKYGNFYILYNEYKSFVIMGDEYSISKTMVIKKISSDGKNLLGIKKIVVEDSILTLSRSIIGKSMTIDENDDIYIIGDTTWYGLPTTPGVIKTKMDTKKAMEGIKTECFIMKFRGDGFNSTDKPIYSTFLGGEEVDTAQTVVVDKGGSVWIGGMTSSRDFPITEQTAYKKEISSIFGNIFVTKINSDFSKIEYSTFLGGEAIDVIYGMAIDSDGNVYATGTADYLVAPEYRSDIMKDMKQGLWNTTKNAYQKKFGCGESDAFVIKFKPNGEVEYLTYLGGNKMDLGTSINVDEYGCPYILGYTKGDFIITENSYLKIYDAKEAGIFIAKLSKDGKEVIASTYFGGSYGNYSKAIKVQDDMVYIVGATNSLDFEVTESAFQNQYKIGLHGFLSIFNGNLSELKYSTFIEGSSTDIVGQVDVDETGSVILAGGTSSADFPTTKGVYRESYSNNPEIKYMSGDGFLMKLIISITG